MTTYIYASQFGLFYYRCCSRGSAYCRLCFETRPHVWCRQPRLHTTTMLSRWCSPTRRDPSLSLAARNFLTSKKLPRGRHTVAGVPPNFWRGSDGLRFGSQHAIGPASTTVIACGEVRWCYSRTRPSTALAHPTAKMKDAAPPPLPAAAPRQATPCSLPPVGGWLACGGRLKRHEFLLQLWAKKSTQKMGAHPTKGVWYFGTDQGRESNICLCFVMHWKASPLQRKRTAPTDVEVRNGDTHVCANVHVDSHR